ncbi:anti-FecI sigma factor, FecR [gut metagenome]|uniref:Anti-FecI sigma factor, FecR n=1 Tax=gut metagenome TaxID=749906 RepID=J9CQP2_9ZZZZ
MKTTDVELLIARKVWGDLLTEAEEHALQVWLAEKEENRQFYDEIKKEKFDAAAYHRYRQIDSDKAWEEFLKATERSQPSLLHRLLKYACMFSIPLIAAGMAFYFLQSPLVTDEDDKADAVVPGTTGALWHDASGNTVKLNSQTLQEQPYPTTDSNVVATAKGVMMKVNKAAVACRENDTDQSPHILKTLNNGEFQIILEDGTLVHLNYNTTLRFPRHFSKKERLVYLHGEAFFQVAKDSVRPFKVMTDEMVVKQYGTSFNVNTYSPTQTEVVLVEGSIGVLSSAKEYAMRPSDRLTFHKNTAEVEIQQIDVTPYIAWHEGRFIFNNEPLSSIMNTLSHWYDVEVIFDCPEWKQLHFTGNMNRYGQLAPILKAISQTVELRMEIKNHTVHISEKKQTNQ